MQMNATWDKEAIRQFAPATACWLLAVAVTQLHGWAQSQPAGAAPSGVLFWIAGILLLGSMVLTAKACWQAGRRQAEPGGGAAPAAAAHVQMTAHG